MPERTMRVYETSIVMLTRKATEQKGKIFWIQASGMRDSLAVEGEIPFTVHFYSIRVAVSVESRWREVLPSRAFLFRRLSGHLKPENEASQQQPYSHSHSFDSSLSSAPWTFLLLTVH